MCVCVRVRVRARVRVHVCVCGFYLFGGWFRAFAVDNITEKFLLTELTFLDVKT